ncbi:Uncharacterized protein TCAP_01580 [Tolypocladium capitatum]|uniref:Uncharacterized protein n=1 Tax=Tolypocladium capitatum TaxID=45235 RepID=A0A2K3QLU6_9HYPO|nr:Uncharacterized protein TCAP_01580 [Tolypocladium capitatum]
MDSSLGPCRGDRGRAIRPGLTGGELAGVEVLGQLLQGRSLSFDALGSILPSSHLSVVSEQLLEVLGSQNVDLGKQQLTLNKGRVAVVQDSPDGHEILQLPPGLLNNAVLARQDNGHAGQILNLGVADDERVDIKASGSENPRKTGQDTGLVLDQAVEDVALRGDHGRSRGLVEDAIAEVELLLEEWCRTAPSEELAGRLLAAATRRRGAPQDRSEAIWRSIERTRISLTKQGASQLLSMAVDAQWFVVGDAVSQGDGRSQKLSWGSEISEASSACRGTDRIGPRTKRWQTPQQGQTE